MSLNSSNLVIPTILFVSILISVAYWITVSQAVKQLPRITPSNFVEFDSIEKAASPTFQFPTVSIIIPAFNEEENIEDCVKSVITSTQLPEEKLEIWIIDDQSTDCTLEILRSLKRQLSDARLHVLSGLPRPDGQTWTGKNWACQQGAEHASGDFLLFIDADVRLQPHAILAVIQAAIAQDLDFLTCIPTVVCGSLIEWLVQPLMFINLLVSFNSRVVRDPKTKTTYALGPFLLFRASAYRTVGMHAAVAAHVAEDVAFARRLKQSGFKLQQFIGTDLATLRMYRNQQALWEGWTKNLYVGAQRSLMLMLLLVVVMVLVYTVPWIGFAIATVHVLTDSTRLHLIELGLAGVAIAVQYQIRQQGSQALGTSTKYWWLQSMGGLLIGILAIVSIIKVETGWGWTWRGRKLDSEQTRL